MRKVTAILFAVGLSVSGLSGAAQAADDHGGGGGGGHFGGGSFSHSGGGGHFGGHYGGHGGGHYGGHGGYGGYGYGLGFGLGLGALYYGYPYSDVYGAPYYYDYEDYPDGPPPDVTAGAAPPAAVPGYWYRCDSPAGYYPYVATCSHPWQTVPAMPPPPDGDD